MAARRKNTAQANATHNAPHTAPSPHPAPVPPPADGQAAAVWGATPECRQVRNRTSLIYTSDYDDRFDAGAAVRGQGPAV